MMPTAKSMELAEPRSTGTEQETVPVLVSAGSTNTGTKPVPRTALPLSRFTKVTRAFRISPNAVSPAALVVAVMSWMVAANTMVAVLLLLLAVLKNMSPL